MAGAHAGTWTGVKIVVFTVVLVYAYLTHHRLERFNLGWMGLTAVSFITMSSIEMLVFLGNEGGTVIFPVLMEVSTRTTITDTLYLLGGVGVLGFLWSLRHTLTE